MKKMPVCEDCGEKESVGNWGLDNHPYMLCYDCAKRNAELQREMAYASYLVASNALAYKLNIFLTKER